jgi:hypothetical protein
MTRQKDLKRLVRARMTKTGESYTTARAQVTRKPESKPALSLLETSADTADFAKLGGMSDEIVREKTGRTWKGWVDVLDAAGAQEMAHRDIAALLNKQFEVIPWWCQMVTVGYERIKGLRAKGQRRDGSYEAGKSRTYNVPVETLFDAWADARTRRKWMDGATMKVRTATKPKSMRLDWPEGGIIAVGFLPKGKGKSSVALSHTKLPDRETVKRLKQYWSDRLDALGEVLSSE